MLRSVDLRVIWVSWVATGGDVVWSGATDLRTFGARSDFGIIRKQHCKIVCGATFIMLCWLSYSV